MIGAISSNAVSTVCRVNPEMNRANDGLLLILSPKENHARKTSKPLHMVGPSAWALYLDGHTLMVRPVFSTMAEDVNETRATNEMMV